MNFFLMLFSVLAIFEAASGTNEFDFQANPKLWMANILLDAPRNVPSSGIEPEPQMHNETATNSNLATTPFLKPKPTRPPKTRPMTKRPATTTTTTTTAATTIETSTVSKKPKKQPRYDCNRFCRRRSNGQYAGPACGLAKRARWCLVCRYVYFCGRVSNIF